MGMSDRPLGMHGARLSTAGDDGVRIWRWNEALGSWDQETIDHALPVDAQGAPRLSSAAATSTSCDSVHIRDVAWKPWSGTADMLASASGSSVCIWTQDVTTDGTKTRWRAQRCVAVGEDVWKVSWQEMGN